MNPSAKPGGAFIDASLAGSRSGRQKPLGLNILLKESAVYGLGTVLARALGILLTPILSRLFTAAEFGVLDLLQTGVSFGVLFAALQLDSALMRYAADEDGNDVLVTSLVLQGCAAAVCLGIFALMLGHRLWSGLEAAPLSTILVAAFTVPANIFYTSSLTLLRGRREAATASSWIAVNTALNVGSVLLLTVGLHWGVAGVFAGRLIADLACAAAIFNHAGVKGSFHLGQASRLLRFSLPLLPDNLMTLVRSHAGKLFLLSVATVSEVGVLALASRVALVTDLCLAAFLQAWVPYGFSAAGRPEEKSAYAQAFRLYVIVTGVLVAGLVLFSREIVLVVGGARFIEAAPLVGVIVAASAINCLHVIFNTALMADEKTGYIMLAAALATGVNISAAYFLTRWLGMMGAPWANLVSALSLSLVVFACAQKIRPMPYGNGMLAVYLLAICALAAAASAGVAGLALSLRAPLLLIAVAAAWRVSGGFSLRGEAS